MMFISASITNWLATKLGGEGTSDPIAFLLGAIIAPGYLIDSAVGVVLLISLLIALVIGCLIGFIALL
jgi:hypothetical protein